MTRTPLLLVSAIVASALLRPGLSRAGAAFEQIEKDYGVALEEQPVDTCKLNNVAAPCYVPYPPGNVIVPAATPDSLRRELEKAGLKKADAVAAPSVPISKPQALNAQVCRSPIAEAYKKNDACLDHSYWGTQTWRQIGDKFAAAQKAHPGLSVGWGTTGCGAPQVGRFCVEVKDKEGKSLTEGLKAYDGDLAKLDEWITRQAAAKGPKAEAARKACPPADRNRSPRDLAELIAKRKENSPDTGGLSAADFLLICATQDTGSDLASIGMTREKAQGLMDLVKPKKLDEKGAERAKLEAACTGGSDPAACDKLSRLVVKDELGKQCSGGDESACDRLSRVVTQEELDKRPEVKKRIARAKAYGADTEQAARYDKYVQKHFKDPKQQDLMERLMRANPETMGKLMEQNTQCEATKNAAACDRKFYSNYLGLANGRPVSEVGRRYLANMCAMPENKDVDACKHEENYAVAKRKHAAPPDPAARPSAASTGPQAFFSGLFGGKVSRGHYIKGTTLPCDNVNDRDADCEWR